MDRTRAGTVRRPVQGRGRGRRSRSRGQHGSHRRADGSSGRGRDTSILRTDGTLEAPADIYEKGRLRIDFDAYEVVVDGRPARLFLREFQLLRLLVRSANRVFTREEIIDALWGGEASVDARTVDVHIHRLRACIERDDVHPELIVTVRGVGYKFADRTLADH
jgi:two-component system response regulator RegX3